MDEVLKYIILFGIHAAAMSALFAILFVSAPLNRIMRAFTVALGAVAIGLPVYAMFDTLGRPSPWPEPGRYVVRGWKFDEPERAMYVFVVPEGRNGDAPKPEHYQVPFVLETALKLQEARENAGAVQSIHMNVEPYETGEEPPVSFDFEMSTIIRNPNDDRARQAWETARDAQLEREAAEEAAREEGEPVDEKK